MSVIGLADRSNRPDSGCSHIHSFLLNPLIELSPGYHCILLYLIRHLPPLRFYGPP